ncbi:helix-turn-helix transcriptional regulator [Halostagnicola kamekurae]|uniref:IclR helix-turn-helix domain-containing protein n=1 Tax=Halostagnicola kamekurae TaxID=619731 RepID=A0A1I6QR47_9EURY|nr:hypothetical protein [Halostagnicola kamekurae]SFS54842.1 hypothetical protein SAMN04488556_1464 [Halostagnicola kamekurae]
MTRSLLVGLLVLVLVLGTLSGSALASEAVTSTPSSDIAPAVDEQPTEPSIEPAGTSQEFDDVTFEITIHENGSATWTFQYERVLENESNVETNESENFREWADDFESGETELYESFQYQAESLTESGAERSGRDASATNFHREAYVEQAGINNMGNETGVVEMSFVWNGFAEVERDGTVRAGDVFDEWPLLENQLLTVSADDPLVFQSVHEGGEYNGETLANANSVTWSGQMKFLPGEPHIVLENTERSSATGPAGVLDWLGSSGTGSLLILALIIAGLIGAGTLARSRDMTRSDESTAEADSSRSEGAPTATQSDANEVQEAALLTDEDRVVSMIEDNGGRMKQVDIVEETGWSKSKVSMLLSEMEDEGTISKLRVGRENIISLEGHEPEATKSPFDE